MISLLFAAALSTADLNTLLDQGVEVSSFKRREAAMSDYIRAAGHAGYVRNSCNLASKATSAAFELKEVKLKAEIFDPQAASYVKLDEAALQQVDLRILEMEKQAASYRATCDTGL